MSYFTEIKIVDENGNQTNASNPFNVEVPPLISTVNSTTVPLAIDATFTGTGELINGFGIIYISVFADVASAVDGLQVEQSVDGTNWDHCDTFTIPANTGKTFSINPYAKYMRIVYVNGGTIQTAFRLQTIFKQNGLASSHRIQDSISSDDDATLIKAVITGQSADNVFRNVKADIDGNLTVTDNASGLSISEGKITGKSFIHKFGAANEVDTADNFATIWDGVDSTIGTGKIATYTYSTSADIDTLSSSDNSDTMDIEIQGLDTNYDILTQTITLTGQTPVVLPTEFIRVFRMKNVDSTDITGEVYIYVNGTSVTLGVPQTNANVRAIINNGNNQTLMAIYTIPAGTTGYMRSWFAGLATKKTASSVIKLKSRPFGQVFQVKHVSSVSSVGTAHINFKYDEPEVFTEMTDIYIEMDTDVNDIGVSAGFDIVLVV